jgi:hypothetical protein
VQNIKRNHKVRGATVIATVSLSKAKSPKQSL